MENVEIPATIMLPALLKKLCLPRPKYKNHVAAVRYMESCANTVIKDLNYNRLKQLQKENKYLKDELRKARLKSARLGRGWFLSLRCMRSFAAQFHNMAILGYFGGQQTTDDDGNTSFYNINATAQMMRERSGRLQKKLEQIKMDMVVPPVYNLS